MNAPLIMQGIFPKRKKEISTYLSYEKRKLCRTFSNKLKKRQVSLSFDSIPYQFMPNNFFAFSVVFLATSSYEIPLIDAISSATN